MLGPVLAILGSLLVICSGWLTHRIYEARTRTIVRYVLMAAGTVITILGILSFPILR